MARFTEIVYPVKKLIPMTADLAARIRDFRHKHQISSENEAVRQLIELGLETTKQETAK